MESLTTALRQPQEDRFATIRRRNKQLILAFFILIFAVAVITGGIIVHLIRQHNLKSETLKPSPGIREYCIVQFNCISFLTHSIKFTHDSTPTQILNLSLETAFNWIGKLLPTMFGSDSNINPRFQSTAQNCSRWLRHSLSQLNETIRIALESDPDEQTRMIMLEEVTAAWYDLKRCVEDLENALFTAAGEETVVVALYAARTEVYNTKSLVGYGADFLRNFDMANENFNFQYAMSGDERLSRIVEDLSGVTLFGSYYLVVLLLFCLILRIY